MALCLQNCRFAKGRNRYCIGGTDSHFCAQQSGGILENFLEVEC